MKMLVSDYDGTFYLNDEDVQKNVVAVDSFMQDNCFVIATGRSYYDWQKKEKEYGIKYNYLIINHGATVLKDNKIIYNLSIDNIIKDELLVDLKLETTVKYFACSALESRVPLKNDNLTKIYVRYNTYEEANNIKENLERKYANYICCFFVGGGLTIEVVAKNVNKANAIKMVAALENISENQIYTIGDGYTDIEMIKCFNGYAMVNSVAELKQVAISEYGSVLMLITDLLK